MQIEDGHVETSSNWPISNEMTHNSLTVLRACTVHSSSCQLSLHESSPQTDRVERQGMVWYTRV